MFNSLVAFAARTVGAVVCIGAPSVSLTPAAAATDGMYGNPAAAARYWQQQSLEDNCGLMSVADVVGEVTGHVPTEEQMVTLAEKTPSGTNPGPLYAPRNDPSHAGDNGGIEMADEVVLLNHYGVKSVMTQTGLTALEQYLGSDRKIIAWVNSAIIWDTRDERTKADHFLVVTEIDTNTEIVHLNDPGADHPDEQVTIATFTWHTGGESIVVTAAVS
jgi:Peptidase_C39 like family